MIDRAPWPNDPVAVKQLVAALALSMRLDGWSGRQQLLIDFCCASWPSPRAQDQ